MPDDLISIVSNVINDAIGEEIHNAESVSILKDEIDELLNKSQIQPIYVMLTNMETPRRDL